MTWLASATVASGGLQYLGGQQAAETSAAGTQAGIDEQRAARLDANRLNRPFYEAAAGSSIPAGMSPELIDAYRTAQAGGELSQVQEMMLSMNQVQQAAGGGGFSQDQFAQAIQHQDAPQQGALSQFQAGIDQAPETISIDPFTGQAVAAPTIDRFQGQAVDAPQLGRFDFDVNQAMESPAMQFQRQMGEQQMDRAVGKNRQLGSGQRLLEAQKFGQGLATQSLDDEFRRQLQTAQQQQGTDVQQFGLGSTNLAQRQQLNALGNQQAIQQQDLGRQFLSDEQALNALSNQQLAQQYGIDTDAHNTRMNRLTDLVKVGTGAGTAMGNQAMQTGANVSNMLQSGANTQAAQQLGGANVIGGTLTNLANIAGQNQSTGGGGGGYNSMNWGGANNASGAPIGMDVNTWIKS